MDRFFFIVEIVDFCIKSAPKCLIFHTNVVNILQCLVNDVAIGISDRL